MSVSKRIGASKSQAGQIIEFNDINKLLKLFNQQLLTKPN